LGGTRKLPYAFTENGVAMLSSVLNSKRAIQVNIQIMRTFIKIREMLTTHKELRQRIEELEKKYDAQFKVIFDAIRQLMTPLLCPLLSHNAYTDLYVYNIVYISWQKAFKISYRYSCIFLDRKWSLVYSKKVLL